MKFIIVTGGVISGIGKGSTCSSIGLLFQTMGFTVTMIKIDPYLNTDASLLSPYEHGECFVTEDGGETDLDIGGYERTLGINLTKNHNITTGQIYKSVIDKERKGEYLGKTVQVVPHITDEIIRKIKYTSKLRINNKVPDICIVELGGTIGDLEGLPFVEAIQQMKMNDEDNFCFVHVGMIINNPEPKTKPIQHSVATLRGRGIFPDLLIVRNKDDINQDIKSKLSKMCQIKVEDIIASINVDSTYEIPTNLNNQNICQQIGKRLKLEVGEVRNPYENTFKSQITSHTFVYIGLMGKYMLNDGKNNPDMYLSLLKALEHVTINTGIVIQYDFIESTDNLSKYDGLIILGGFGSKGIKEKLEVAKYARENKVPILGLCLGMQVMVVDCFNNLVGKLGCSSEWSGLNLEVSSVNTFDTTNSTGVSKCTSTEFKYEHKVIDILHDQNEIMGGTMRIGSHPIKLLPSKVKDIYKEDIVYERFRHRYFVNTQYVKELQNNGLRFVGSNDNHMDICELLDHPFYIGTQYHPEYKSKPMSPHPLFVEFIKVCKSN
jgi:CTP synthase